MNEPIELPSLAVQAAALYLLNLLLLPGLAFGVGLDEKAAEVGDAAVDLRGLGLPPGLHGGVERVGGGRAELVLVNGYSGIGKTALVGELHRPIVARRGYFIRGKCDQYSRNQPYSALIQAFQQLLRQLAQLPQLS